MLNITSNGTDGILLEELNDEALRRQLPAIVYSAAMMIIGTPGNAIVLYVYFFKWRRSTSRMFILYLAFLDLVNCITTLPMEIFIMCHSVTLDLPSICKLSRFSTYTLNSSSALILVGIAVDRFKRICRPYQRTFSETISKRICIGAIVVSLSLTWPAIILYGTRRFQIGQIKGSSCLIENKYDETPYPIVFFGIMAFMTFGIFTTVSFLYYFVGIQIYKHRMFKIKNCSHVEQVVEDKSTEKSQNGKQSNEAASKASRDKESNGVVGNGIAITYDKASESDKFHTAQSVNEDAAKEITDDDLLRIPVSTANELSSDRSIYECSTVNIELESQTPLEAQPKLTEETKENEPSNSSRRNSSPTKRVKKRRTRVRYMLVRGASTLNSSGRTKCTSCLTIRVGKSTFMLFLITIAYIISFLPFYIIAIIRQSNTLFVQQLTPAGAMAYYLFLRSYLLSSAINPIIYSFCNAQFRGYCLDLFKRIFTRHAYVDDIKLKARRR